MKNICVYLGANIGLNPAYSQAILILGKEMADHGYTLIYGGSSLGLMGLLANTVKDNGGAVIGIITDDLIAKEIPLANLDELIVVSSMQDRKKLMQDKSDAFIVMPGGLGTLEEALETWNAIKIGILKKPIGFMNINSYYDGLFAFMDVSKKEGFISQDHINIPIVDSSPIKLLQNLTLSLDDKDSQQSSDLVLSM